MKVFLFYFLFAFSIFADEPRYKVFPIPGKINTDMQEFGPSLTRDGQTLYFYSKRNGSNYTDIYKSEFKNGKWSNPVPVTALNSNYDDQSPYVDPDEKFIIFSSNRDGAIEFQMPNGQKGVSRDLFYSENIGGQWSKPYDLADTINTEEMEENPYVHENDLYFTRYPFGDSSKAKIFRSKYNGVGFSEPEELPFPINAEPYSSIAAVISRDGKYIYFSSNRPGGYGGYDIYRSRILKNGYDEPENLGPEVNTEGNEAYLIINPSDDTILFCRKEIDKSYDIYAAIPLKKDNDLDEKKIAAKQKEKDSPKSEKYAKNDSPESKKPGTTQIEKTEKTKQPGKIPEDDKTRPEIYLKKDSGIQTTKKKELDPGPEKTEKTAKKFEPEPTKNTSIKEGNIPETKQPEKVKDDPKKEDIAQEFKTRKKISLRTINFEINSSELKDESLPFLDAIADYMQENKEVKMKITGHTDLTGDFDLNQQLSVERAIAVKDYLATKGISGKRLITEGKGSTQPIIKRTDIESNKINRRTEFEIVE